MEKALKAIEQGFIYIGGIKHSIRSHYSLEIKNGTPVYTFTLTDKTWHSIEIIENGFEVEPPIKKLQLSDIELEFVHYSFEDKYMACRKALKSICDLISRDHHIEIACAMGYKMVRENNENYWVKK